VQFKMGVFSRQNYSGVMIAGMLACSVGLTSRNLCASVAPPSNAPAHSLPQRSAEDWSATILSDPAMKRLEISPSTTSLLPAESAKSDTLSTAASSDPGLLPLTPREAPAAIPVAPAAPIGGLTLLVFAIPMLSNRRLRRWLLR
jgi:hypothetical protein